jgi:pimeloyl-ACP methyl ester carboxylesterase
MLRLAVASSLALLVCGVVVAAPVAPVGAPVPAWTPKSFTVQVSGTGRPIIFIPGLTCDGSVWDATVAHFGGHVQAHVLSLAGFGATPPIAQPMLPTAHDEIIEYIKQNHLDHPIIVGHSLGAYLAFWVAETAPDQIGGLVAVDGAPFFPALFDVHATVESSRSAAKAMSDRMAALTGADFKAAISRFFNGMVADAKARDRIDAIGGKSDPRTTGDAMFYLFTHDLRPDVANISVPTLVLAADTGGDIPLPKLHATWEAQLGKIPHHEVVVVGKSRHFVMLDQPVAFDAALDKFLAR